MYETRRQYVMDAMKEHSLGIIYADREVCRNFFYLTGIERAGMILLLVKNNSQSHATLFIQKPDPLYEKWNGKLMTAKEASDLSGIEDIAYLEDFEATVLRYLERSGIENLYFNLDEFSLSHTESMSTREAKRFGEHFPALHIENLYPIIGTARMQKDEDEVAKIRKAILMTKNGLEAVMKHLRPNLYEYQVQAVYEYAIKYQGSIKPSFPTIAGAGYNGTMLHYGTNRDLCHDGDLILLDLGAMYEGYCSDITRTYPVNGHFTERQKQIYDIVLQANEAVRKAARPGLTTIDLNNVCKEVLASGLMEIGLIHSADELGKYYMHGVSHHLGLDVHDVTIASNVLLKPGAVISNEPGLYIEEEAIGIRIEDDLLITEDGCEVLSKDIMRTTEEIEAFMQKYHS